MAQCKQHFAGLEGIKLSIFWPCVLSSHEPPNNLHIKIRLHTFRFLDSISLYHKKTKKLSGHVRWDLRYSPDLAVSWGVGKALGAQSGLAANIFCKLAPMATTNNDKY